jgi:hypothetical protein
MRDRRITKRLVDSLKVIASEYFVWDDTLVGFGVRVQASGAHVLSRQIPRRLGRVTERRRITNYLRSDAMP